MYQAAACTHGVMLRSYSVCIDLLPGGTLKIHGESISPSQPTTTVLLSSEDTAEYAVKVALERYHIEKEDPANYCLVQVRDAPPSTKPLTAGSCRVEIRIQTTVLR